MSGQPKEPIKISLEVFEVAVKINKQLIMLLEKYIKKSGEWSGTMIAEITSARESLETQQEMVEILKKAQSLDNT